MNSALKYKRIFNEPSSSGTSPADIARITTLENNEYKVAYFASVNTESGTITIPTGASILLDQFPGGVDAYVSTISSGQPTGNNPITAGSTIVDVTSFDALGNYTLTSTPNSFPVALIYILKIKAKDWSNLVTNNIIEYEQFTYVGTSPIIINQNTKTVSISQSNTSTNGYLNSTDWNTFNGKQAAGNYITGLTGDITATGPGSVASTLASIISASTKGGIDKTLTIQYDAKGRLLVVTENSIQITESQVTNLTADLINKQSSTLTNTHILVGNASNIATDVAVSGDITISNTGVTTLASVIASATKGGTDKTLTINYDAKGRLLTVTENTISIVSTQVSDFNEAAQDAVGNILTDSSTVDFTYSDVSNTITAIIIDASVTNAKLANMATQTFKGRTTAGSGSPEDLTKAQAQTILGLPSSSTDNQIVRYDGITGNIQGSSLIIDDNGGIITSGTTTSTFTAKKIEYDNTLNQWLMYDNDSTTSLNVGYETWFTCFNNTGSTIPNGSIVYISGTSGGIPTIALAKADVGSTAVGIGITTETIANNASGKVTQSGLVNGINTSGLTAGAVYVSEITAGALTNTAPVAPNYRMRVGFVGAINATTGTILVTPSTAALGNGTANQVFGINAAGTSQEVKSILGTASDIVVTNAANSITLSTGSNIYKVGGTDVAVTDGGTGASTAAAARTNLGTLGYSLIASLATTTQSPADSATYYFGSVPRNALTTVAGSTRVYIPKVGTIKAVFLFFSQTAGSNETSTLSIRLNNTTDTTINAAVTNDAAQTIFSNTALAITVIAGDYFEIKWPTPIWATNPLVSLASATIYIE